MCNARAACMMLTVRAMYTSCEVNTATSHLTTPCSILLQVFPFVVATSILHVVGVIALITPVFTLICKGNIGTCGGGPGSPPHRRYLQVAATCSGLCELWGRSGTTLHNTELTIFLPFGLCQYKSHRFLVLRRPEVLIYWECDQICQVQVI